MGILKVNWLTDSFHADDNLTDPDVRRLLPGGLPMVRIGPFVVATHAEERVPFRWEGLDSAERLLLKIHYPGWSTHEEAMVGVFREAVASCELYPRRPMQEAKEIAEVLQGASVPLFLRLAFLSHLEDLVTTPRSRLAPWVYEVALQAHGRVPVLPETIECFQAALHHVEVTRNLRVWPNVVGEFRDSMFDRTLTLRSAYLH